MKYRIEKKAKHFQSYFPFIVLFILGILSVPLSLSAADTNSPTDGTSVLAISADRQFAFAEKYFSTGEYYRAIGEYQRFIFFFARDIRVERAMHRIGMAYFKGEKFPDAIDAFNQLIQRYPDTALSMDSYLMIGECYTRIGRPESAQSTLHDLIGLTDKADIKDEANYRIGWIHVDLASWEEAQSHFGEIREENRKPYRLQRLLSELEKEKTIVRKNPRLAGFLSILPGGGYAYLGRYQDAATAFLLNTGLIVAAVIAFEDDNPALGGVIAFVGSGFYFGNIFGAVSSTHKYNKAQTGRFIQRLKANTKINLLADRQHGGVMVALELAF